MLFRNIAVTGEDYTVLDNTNILTEGDTIRYIGAEVPPGYTGAVYDGRGKVALPGFFNLHCHVPMTLLRGYGEGLPLHRWLERMFPFEALLTEEDKYWGALLGIAEMLASGTVSFSDMYVARDAILRAVDDSGIKANLSCGALPGKGTRVLFADDQSFAGTQLLRREAAALGHGRIIAELAIHAEYTSEAPIVRDIADFAAQTGMRIHLHLSETQREHEEAKAARGMTPAAWFDSLGVFRLPVTAAHCVWIEDGDFEILARAQATVAHNPSSNLKLGSGIAPVKEVLARGVRVGIGTDGAASNNNLNMLEEVALAGLLHKGVNRDPLCLGAAQLMELACKNGALAQGRADCGALAPGNRADIVVYDLDRPHLRPVFDPLSNILCAANAGDVTLTMVDGQVLYRDGVYSTIDIEQVKHRADEIAARTAARL